jgi:hypothetical protein
MAAQARVGVSHPEFHFIRFTTVRIFRRDTEAFFFGRLIERFFAAAFFAVLVFVIAVPRNRVQFSDAISQVLPFLLSARSGYHAGTNWPGCAGSPDLIAYGWTDPAGHLKVSIQTLQVTSVKLGIQRFHLPSGLKQFAVGAKPSVFADDPVQAKKPWLGCSNKSSRKSDLKLFELGTC